MALCASKRLLCYFDSIFFNFMQCYRSVQEAVYSSGRTWWKKCPCYSFGEKACFSPPVRQVLSFSLFLTQSRYISIFKVPLPDEISFLSPHFCRPTVHSRTVPPSAHANGNSVEIREFNKEASNISGFTDSLD